MNQSQTSPLALDKVKQYFPYHRICLLRTLLLLVNCIIQSNSCNLNKAKKKGSIVLGRQVKVQTIYTRFIRLFKMKGIEGFVIGLLQLVLNSLLLYTGHPSAYYLAIDRTNWNLGKLNINILFVGFVLSNGRFIPLYFKLLDKRGNSSQAERMELIDGIDWFFERFQDLPIIVLGDREFIGKHWFAYLSKRLFDFVIRLRKKDYRQLLAEHYGWSVAKLEKKIAKSIKKRGYFMRSIEIQGQTFYYHVFAKRKENNNLAAQDKYIRFMSTSADHEWVVLQYDKRWKIEVFFEDCKTKGFDLEAINFTSIAKIRLMVAICSLCYALCLMEGMIEYKKRQPSMKLDKKSGKNYPRTSIFTRGFERIEQIVVNFNALVQYLNSKLTAQITVNQKLISKNLYAY